MAEYCDVCKNEKFLIEHRSDCQINHVNADVCGGSGGVVPSQCSCKPKKIPCWQCQRIEWLAQCKDKPWHEWPDAEG